MSDGTSDKPRITIACVDVTEHVRALFDALAGSWDGFHALDVATLESALILAELAGFEASELGARTVDSLTGILEHRRAQARAMREGSL